VLFVVQFVAVVKTTTETDMKKIENSMMMITRILPTVVMVPSHHSK
jgi:hypothetical protein